MYILHVRSEKSGLASGGEGGGLLSSVREDEHFALELQVRISIVCCVGELGWSSASMGRVRSAPHAPLERAPQPGARCLCSGSSSDTRAILRFFPR